MVKNMKWTYKEGRSSWSSRQGSRLGGEAQFKVSRVINRGSTGPMGDPIDGRWPPAREALEAS